MIFQIIFDYIFEGIAWISHNFLKKFFPKYDENSKDQSWLSLISGIFAFILLTFILIILVFGLPIHLLGN